MMALRRVIRDSDDEDDNDLIMHPSPTQFGAGNDTSGREYVRESAESTDPVLFQKLYDANMAALERDPSEPPSSIPLPTLEELVRPLKTQVNTQASAGADRRTCFGEESSLTSISEPTASNRKAKRAKSAMNASDLTQVTTPSGEKNQAETQGNWDFSSSVGLDMYSAVKSRHANKEKKTYGKQKLGRSKTMIATTSGDRSLGTTTSAAPDLRRVPRLKERASVNGDVLALDGSEVINLISASSNSASIQVPRSTSEEAAEHNPKDLDSTAVSLPPPTREQVASSESVDQGPLIMDKVRLQQTLTPSQKQSYQYISLDIISDHDSMPATIDTAPFTDLNSSRFDEMVARDLPDGRNTEPLVQHEPPRITDQPSRSPVLPSIKQHSKRTRSYSTAQEASFGSRVNIFSNVHNARDILPHRTQITMRSSRADKYQDSTTSTTLKKLRRTRTTEQRGSPIKSQVSVDELSLQPIEADENTCGPPAKDNKRRRSDKQKDPISMEELPSSPDIGLSAERYIPRPTRRGSNFSVIDQAGDDIPKSLRLPRPPANQSTSDARSDTNGNRPSGKVVDSMSFGCGETDLGPPPLPRTSNDRVEDYTAANMEREELPDHGVNVIEDVQAEQSSVLDNGQSCNDVISATKRRGRPRKTSVVTEKLVRSIIANVSKIAKRGDVTGQVPLISEVMVEVPCAKEVESPAAEQLSSPVNPEASIILTSTPRQKITRKRKGRARTKTMPVFASEKVIIDSDDEEDDFLPHPAPAKKRLVASKQKSPAHDETALPDLTTAQDTSLDAMEEEEVYVPVVAKKKSGPKKKIVSTTSEDVAVTPSPVVEGNSEVIDGAQASWTVDDAPTSKEQDVEALTTPSQSKGPGKHSPIPSGAIRYRVGLSRKSRIAPLLKMRPALKKT